MLMLVGSNSQAFFYALGFQERAMSTTVATNRLLSAEEAAEYLNVRVQTLAVWRSCKRYPDLFYIKVGNAVKYRQSDLDRWLESRTVGES